MDGSVIVAGFELIRITSIPSSRMERADCDPRNQIHMLDQ
jgi:hypothetical protein